MKHLIDLDEDALERARKHLGMGTIKATVNAALRLAAGDPSVEQRQLLESVDALAAITFEDRESAW